MNLPDGSRRLLIIVAREELSRYEDLMRQFVGDERVEVIFDRRICERRQVTLLTGVERRRADRRRIDSSSALRSRGWAIIQDWTPDDGL